MGIRFKSDHLTCPACGAAYTPLNRCESDHTVVTNVLMSRFPQWDSNDVACEECVTNAYASLTDSSLIGRLKSRLRSPEDHRSLHRYRINS